MEGHTRGLFSEYLKKPIFLSKLWGTILFFALLIISIFFSFLITYTKEDITMLITAEQIIVLFISAVTIVFRESILSFSYISKINNNISYAKQGNIYINHSSIAALTYDGELKTSSFTDLMAIAEEDMIKYKRLVEKYKRFFNAIYLIMMTLVLAIVLFYSSKILDVNHLIVKTVYVFQYFAVLAWAFLVAQIEGQKNNILKSFSQENILIKYKKIMDDVHNQAHGIRQDLSLID